MVCSISIIIEQVIDRVIDVLGVFTIASTCIYNTYSFTLYNNVDSDDNDDNDDNDATFAI